MVIPGKKTGDINGTGQAQVFAELNNIITQNNAQDNVHILPIASSVAGGPDTDKANQVKKESLDIDLANVSAHKDAGFSIIGFARSTSYNNDKKPYNDENPVPPEGKPKDAKEFSIGGGNSVQFVQSQTFFNKMSRHQYIQNQLEKIVLSKKEQLDKGVQDKLPDALQNLTEAKQLVRNIQKLLFDKNFGDVIKFYDQSFKDEKGDYKQGFTAPEMAGGGAKFSFPDEKTSMNFLRDFAEKNNGKLYTVRNDEGQVIVQVDNGKIKLFDGKDSFKEAGPDSVIPDVGMANEDYLKMAKSSNISIDSTPTAEAPKDTASDGFNLGAPADSVSSASPVAVPELTAMQNQQPPDEQHPDNTSSNVLN